MNFPFQKTLEYQISSVYLNYLWSCRHLTFRGSESSTGQVDPYDVKYEANFSGIRWSSCFHRLLMLPSNTFPNLLSLRCVVLTIMSFLCKNHAFFVGWSRDLTKIKITLKRLISRRRFLYEKCSVFHPLSIGTNFGMIWRIQFFIYSGARGNTGGVPRGQTGHVQKRHQVTFCSGAHPNHISAIKKYDSTVG